ncbi:MAG: class II glutamine amidotransferase [Rhodospirillaceae bacterium]
MCRWIAYAGPAIHLDTLLLRSENSLTRQSLEAHESISVVNADGLGVGWYADQPHPGIFKDVSPAWNDANLRNIAEQIKSRLFFGHVRATTGSAVNRTNCHPFRNGKFLFMHNGEIGGFEKIRRTLSFGIAPELYHLVEGITDSDVFFFLLLTHGFEENPEKAIAKSIRFVERTQAEASIEIPFTMTVAITEGETIWAMRHATHGRPPTLYRGVGTHPHDALKHENIKTGAAAIVLSEPVDDDTSQWTLVEPDHLVLAGDGGASVSKLTI